MSVFVVSTSVDSAVEFAFVVVFAVVVAFVVVVTFVFVVVIVVASVGSVAEFDFIFVSLFVVRRIRR